MYKVIGILKRPEGMNIEDFRRWWLEEHAPKVKQWHEPLVKRPDMSANIILLLAQFVAAPLRVLLRKRDGLDTATAEALDRIEEDGGPAGDAQTLFKAGRLSDEAVATALDRGDKGFVIDALALRSGYSADKVRRIVESKSPRTVTALAWRAKFGARFAMDLQKRLARIPPHQVLNAHDGLDYPLTTGEMKETLAMFAS